VKDRRANRRIRALVVLFGIVFAATVGRAAYLQVIEGPSYVTLAREQHVETIKLPAGRGTIFDRTGEPLAIGEQATTVYADPRHVVSPKRAAIAVGKTLGLDPDEVYPLLRDRSRGFVYLERKADPVLAAKLEHENIKGIGFLSEERRTYPQRTVAAHVLGYAGTDNKGLEGLERALDPQLSGRPGSETVIRDPFGQAIDVVKSKPERPGRNVVLTLDNQLQSTAERMLGDAVARWGAKGATAVVLDPRTGAILALANAPTFDANRFSSADPDTRRDRALTDMYEPGSTFKIVTIAGALEDNVVTPTSSFVLQPTIQVADRRIHESHWRPTQRMTVRQILYQSSNIGTITVAEKLGAERLSSWIERFGFGRRTGLGSLGESPGLVLPLDQWSGSTIGTVPIGQGIAVTPLQMASAYAAVGNDGVRERPHIVAKIGGKKVPQKPGRRIVSHATANRMMSMFRDVVVEGTGTEAAIPGYTVAGKTGTAQKPENGRYVSKYVASFVGLVPARKPRLAILVMVDEPHGAIWGGVVAAPVFRDLARFALQYLEVPPDAPETAPSGQASGGTATG
jgi:cell division protein FtsI (penicillin-binding protein 3)